MKILGLYNNGCALELFQWLEDQGHDIVLRSDCLDAKWCMEGHFDLTVSYTYRYILSQDILSALHNNVVNIHNALLPWNRGADSNLWSVIDRTPRGVTLHYVNAALDKGYVIAQDIVDDGDDETLASSYRNLDIAAKTLFKKAFKFFFFWPSMKKQCVGEGSYHSLKDGAAIKCAIDSYDVTIADFRARLGGGGRTSSNCFCLIGIAA